MKDTRFGNKAGIAAAHEVIHTRVKLPDALLE